MTICALLSRQVTRNLSFSATSHTFFCEHTHGSLSSFSAMATWLQLRAKRIVSTWHCQISGLKIRGHCISQQLGLHFQNRMSLAVAAKAVQADESTPRAAKSPLTDQKNGTRWFRIGLNAPQKGSRSKRWGPRVQEVTKRCCFAFSGVRMRPQRFAKGSRVSRPGRRPRGSRSP